MAIIKAGTYRFNDVLSAPSVFLDQPLNHYIDIPEEIGNQYDVYKLNGTIVRVTTGFDGLAGDVEFGFVELPKYGAVYFLDTGWVEDLGFSLQTITIPNDSEVSDEFAEWFTVNTKPVTATITYNGSTIFNLFNGQKAILECKGKKMEDNVVVEVAEQLEVGVVEEFDGTITIA